MGDTLKDEKSNDTFDIDKYWKEFLNELEEQKRISFHFWWIYTVGVVIMFYVTFKLIKLTKCKSIRIMLLAICIILTLIAHLSEDLYFNLIKLSK